MVTFSCDSCGDTLKKNQVDKHMGRCRSQTFACIDCNVYFDRKTFREHVKCVSEDQRYGGKNYVAKENKGEVKQNLWVNQVQAAIEHVKDNSLKGLLSRIADFDNIPRKEAKFINFLQNSMRIRDRALCVKAWNAIDTEAKRLKAEEEERKKAEKEAKEAEVSKAKEENENAEASEADGTDEKEEQQAEASDSTTENVKPFKWKKAIKRRMREADDGEMKLKKLRKIVLSDYAVATQSEGAEEDDSLQALFAEKLESAGVVVEGKVVKLSACTYLQDMALVQRVPRLEDSLIRYFLIRATRPDGSRNIAKFLEAFPLPKTLKKVLLKLDGDFVEFAGCYKNIIDFEEHVEAVAVTNMCLDKKETIRNLRRMGSSSLILYQVVCMVAGMEQEIHSFLSFDMFVDMKPIPQTDTAEGLVVSLWAFREILVTEELSENGQDEILMPIKSAMICCLVNKWTDGLQMLLRVTKERRHLFTSEVFVEVFLYIFNRIARSGCAASLSFFMNAAGDVLDQTGFHQAFCEENQAGRLPVPKFALLYSLVPAYGEIQRLLIQDRTGFD
ncbi:hypothetical protein QR680_011464 [Steinernema hermaphroditum]|uniref:Zinc finger C2H2 LYAR-type domain-containing protein n=1 Tax=Steinernema hermaphroditum TaxID=289476 RepID=A0AA39LY47_9BILA|nr:hypothetical protein QR680_011464 [Steinernema hermaphroditum]